MVETRQDDISAEKASQIGSGEKQGAESSLINRLDIKSLLQEAGHSVGGLSNDILHGDVVRGLGLPGVDFTGFGQEAPYHSQGTFTDIMHGLKHAFVKDELLEDKVRSHVESKMTPEEKQKFGDENKALDEYHGRVLGWSMSTMIPPPPMPERAPTPMHSEIEKRVKDTEKQIDDQVKGQMSPADQKRLADQFKDYEKKYDEATKVVAPYITAGDQRLPTSGNAIKDYYDRVAEATEKLISGDK